MNKEYLGSNCFTVLLLNLLLFILEIVNKNFYEKRN